MAELTILKEKEINYKMENHQMEDLNHLLENRKKNIFYAPDASFDDQITVRLTEFNNDKDIIVSVDNFNRKKKIAKMLFIAVSVVFFLVSYPFLGLFLGY